MGRGLLGGIEGLRWEVLGCSCVEWVWFSEAFLGVVCGGLDVVDLVVEW